MINWFNRNPQQSSASSSNPAEQLSYLQSDGVNVTIEELLRYQGKTSLLAKQPTNKVAGRMAGNYLARSKGRGMEFDEVRHYQHGDDIRAIDWRVTARTGKTHTKLFREELERPVLVAADLSPSMRFGSQLLFKSVQTCHLAALLAWHSKKSGDKIGGLVFNENSHSELKPRARQQGVLHYLHALTELHLPFDADNTSDNKAGSESNSFARHCARLRQLAKPGALIYLISDFSQLDHEAVRHLANISRHCELIACHLWDPLELNLPESTAQQALAITDGRSDSVLTLGNREKNQQYQTQAQQQVTHMMTLLRKSGAKILSVTAGAPIENQIQQGHINAAQVSLAQIKTG